MNYDVGDKVVCIDGCFAPGIRELYTALPVEGRTYVVRELGIGQNPVGVPGGGQGDVRVLLVGLVNPCAKGRTVERGFSERRFRPLDQRTTEEKRPASKPVRQSNPGVAA